jgi:hypothetical protein
VDGEGGSAGHNQLSAGIMDLLISNTVLSIMKSLLLLVLAMVSVTSLPARADERAADVEAFMEEYLRLWNAGDAETITQNIYQFDVANSFSTKEGLQAEFNRLKAEGYHRSEKISIKACWINARQALVDLRYLRLKVDGSAMPPKDRSTLYFVKKTPNGLRVNQLIPMNATTNLNCTSYTQTPAA